MMKRYAYILAALLLALFVCMAGCSKVETPPEEETLQGEDVQTQPPESEAQPPEEAEPPQETAEARAREIMAGMTFDEKIGQMFFVPLPLHSAAADMKEYQFGGYVVYRENLRANNGDWITSEQLQRQLDNIRAEAKLAPLFGADEEGGTVTRLSSDPNIFPDGKLEAPQKIWKEQGVGALTEITAAANAVLKQNGISVNLAPVADVVTDRNVFMYARSMGADAETTAELVRTLVSAIEESGVGAVLKHFPGYGNNEDTHKGMVIDERPYEQFVSEDFLPFAAGIEAGAGAVMMSHNIVNCMDAELPASLSPEVHRVLREELGFDGVIMTDDLVMAAADVGNDRSKAVLAVLAGNDLLLTGSYRSEIAQIKAALESGEITEARLDESVLRIIKWKLKLGVME